MAAQRWGIWHERRARRPAPNRLSSGGGGVGHLLDAPGKPPPTIGDHVTLYEYVEAQPWLRMSPATIRRHVATGAIPREFITKHPGPKGRVYLSGDQICRLLAYWASGATFTPPAPTGRPYAGRRARRAAA